MAVAGVGSSLTLDGVLPIRTLRASGIGNWLKNCAELCWRWGANAFYTAPGLSHRARLSSKVSLSNSASSLCEPNAHSARRSSQAMARVIVTKSDAANGHLGHALRGFLMSALASLDGQPARPWQAALTSTALKTRDDSGLIEMPRGLLGIITSYHDEPAELNWL